MTDACFGSHGPAIRAEGLHLSETTHPPSLRTPAHAHPFLCLHFVLRGVYQESREGEDHRLEPGWFLFKPGGVRHWNHFRDGGAVTLRLELEPGTRPALADALPGRMTTVRAPHLATLATRARAELSAGDDVSGVIAESLALEILAGVARLPAPEAERRGLSLARRCATLLDERFREPYRLGLAAEELGVERTGLAKAFRREYGCSVGEYIRHRRVRLVAERLRNGSHGTLAELAADVGFADQSHMTRAFRDAFGLPPGRWRRLHGGRSPTPADPPAD